jgi:hypothetical protein
MTELPLIFFTAIGLSALVTGSGRGSRGLRISGLLVAFACLVVWAYGLFTYQDEAAALTGVIDDFYVTAYLQELLGSVWSGLVLAALALVPVVLVVLEVRRWRR